MRLMLSFVVLLAFATISTSLILNNFLAAREGDLSARVVIFTATPAAVALLALLGRIVLRISALRRQGVR